MKGKLKGKRYRWNPPECQSHLPVCYCTLETGFWCKACKKFCRSFRVRKKRNVNFHVWQTTISIREGIHKPRTSTFLCPHLVVQKYDGMQKWWSTCPVVLSCWLLCHVIYLKLIKEYLFAKLNKVTKWQLFFTQNGPRLSFWVKIVVILWIYSA